MKQLFQSFFRFWYFRKDVCWLAVLISFVLLTRLAVCSPDDGANKTEKVRADLLTFKVILDTYQLQSGMLPTNEQGLKALWAKPTTPPIPTNWRSLLEKEPLDPWGHQYIYRNPSKLKSKKYDLFSMGPDGQPDTADDVGN